MAFELLIGCPPFADDTPEKIFQILNREIENKEKKEKELQSQKEKEDNDEAQSGLNETPPSTQPSSTQPGTGDNSEEETLVKTPAKKEIPVFSIQDLTLHPEHWKPN